MHTDKKNGPGSVKIVAGWLIVKTENIEPREYELYVGINHIGAERSESVGKLQIPVGSDNTVSRGHAVITVTENWRNTFTCILTDNEHNLLGKKSSNGTFINANAVRLAPDKEYKLKDGDTIQVGNTKLVLKTIEKSKDAEDAQTQVINMGYCESVEINHRGSARIKIKKTFIDPPRRS